MLRLVLLVSAAVSSAALAQSVSFRSIFGYSTYKVVTAVDAAGNVYVAGSTNSPNFPVTAGAFQRTFIPAVCGTFLHAPITCPHGFVAKIDPTGTHLVYATYLGGELADGVDAIAVDASGSVYVTGTTSSTAFPVTPGAWQTALGSEVFNGFITKLNPEGSGLVFSTYLPGGQGNAIALDSAGNVFVAGIASGTTFPATPGAFQTNRQGREDAFVLKLNATGSGPIYSTLLGGALTDIANALAIDTAGNAYVAGYTDSTPAMASFADGTFTPFPVTAGAVNRPGFGADAFVAELNPLGTALVYSAVFGGGGGDIVQTLMIDAIGAAYFAGYSASDDFPTTPGAWRAGYGGGFAGKLNRSGSELVYSTYLSGLGSLFAVDQAGNALIMGSTSLPDVQTTPNAILPCFPSDYGAGPYILQLNATGTGLLYSSYSKHEVMAASAPGRVYLASDTAFLDPVDIFAPMAPGIRCAVNAADYRGIAIAPGEVVTLFGAAIGPDQPAGAMIDSTGKIATMLANTRVLVGGVPAPLLYVSRNQINLLAPFEIAGQTQTAIQIETHGVQSLPPFATPVAATAPGILTLAGWGFGQAAALNQDGTINSADNPADQGSIVSLFVTGVGAMTPLPVTGSISAGPLAKPVANVGISMGAAHIPADLQYVGDAPGLISGVVQINATVPKRFQPGPLYVFLDAGGVAALPEYGPFVTVFVR